MKITKRILTILLMLVLFNLSAIPAFAQPVSSNDVDSDIREMYSTINKYTTTWKRDDKTGKYSYPINSDSDIWAKLNHGEKAALCNIPDYVLSDISDEELVELVLNYPLLFDTFMYSTLDEGLNSVANNFTGLKVVLEKDLLNEYIDNLDQNADRDTAVTRDSAKTNSDLYKETFLSSYKNSIVSDQVADRTVSYDMYTETPNGSYVGYYIRVNCLNQKQIETYDKYVKEFYPNCDKLRDATSAYNCHAYAWYSQSANTIAWIDDPFPYMNDGSYQYVGHSPTANNQKVFYDMPSGLHSGIVVNSLKGLIASKWGDGPLMRHNIFDCPYYYIPENTDYISYYTR